ncbi:hypothetical protein GQ600_25888 [Phytophthora cactorum]|nr:hypothetical protein GQ600_25888 [Phytophthora cactorum]
MACRTRLRQHSGTIASYCGLHPQCGGGSEQARSEVATSTQVKYANPQQCASYCTMTTDRSVEIMESLVVHLQRIKDRMRDPFDGDLDRAALSRSANKSWVKGIIQSANAGCRMLLDQSSPPGCTK